MAEVPARLAPLFEPITIGGVEIKNRIARAAHGTALGGPMYLPGEINDAFVAYHEARARGGVGLTILEISSVHPTSPTPIRGWDDAVVPGYASLAEAVRPYGMKLFQQLNHGGHHAIRGPIPRAPWSASDVPSVVSGVVPRPMSRDQIAELVAAYAAAARRVEDGELDGVEIHAAHSYLIGQFISPLTNKRTDDYGGSEENRLRLLREVLNAVRASVSPGFPIGVRLSSEEGIPGGLTPPETAVLATAIEPLVDFIDISIAGYLRFERMVGAMHEARGYELEASEQVSRVVSVPTIVTGRIPTLEMAGNIVRSGAADMVSMVRATIADPDLVRKSAEGRADEVRPCIYCNQGCLGGYDIWGHIGCTVNPSSGHETRVPTDSPDPIDTPRRVLVAGGGPAGLEAARAAALRGHDVVLLEARDRLGGQIAWARTAPHCEELGRIVDWLAAELDRLGVDVRLSTRADEETVMANEPDVVIVATGATPRRDGRQTARPGSEVPGVELPHVLSSQDLLDGSATVGSTALVLDDVGHNEAIACAEELRRRGSDVTFVTRFPSLGTKLQSALRDAPARGRLFGDGFKLLGYSQLAEVAEGECIVRSLDTESDQRCRADTVVLVCALSPERAIVDELAGRAGLEIVVVGDAEAPRDLIAAIHEGHAAGSAA